VDDADVDAATDADEVAEPELEAGAVLHALSRPTSTEATAQRREKEAIVFRLARL
jgi:hypothetical protein